MTLAIQHKTEEKSVSPCFTNPLLSARTHEIHYARETKMESLLGEIGVIGGGRYNFLCCWESVLCLCAHTMVSEGHASKPLLLFGVSLILLNCDL